MKIKVISLLILLSCPSLFATSVPEIHEIKKQIDAQLSQYEPTEIALTSFSAGVILLPLALLALRNPGKSAIISVLLAITGAVAVKSTENQSVKSQ